MSYLKHRSEKLPSHLLSIKQSATRLQAGHSSIVDMPKRFSSSEFPSDEHTSF